MTEQRVSDEQWAITSDVDKRSAIDNMNEEAQRLRAALQAALDREAALKAEWNSKLAGVVNIATGDRLRAEAAEAREAALKVEIERLTIDRNQFLRDAAYNAERCRAAEASNRALVEAQHNEREALRACLWHLGTEEDRKHMAEYGYGWRFGSRVSKEKAADMARTALAAALTALQAGEEAK